MSATLHDQTIFADPRRGDGHDATGEPGDCFRTCLAIIAGTDPASMPNFVRFESWWTVARIWAVSIGRDLAFLDDAEAARSTLPAWFPAGTLVIASGPSPRGAFYHCVVADLNLEMVHDPHPSRAGLSSVEGVEYLLPLPMLPAPYVKALAA